MQFIPSVKISAELESGYQPYFNMQMVISVADKTKFNALDIALPEMSVKPYGEYKVGVNKNFTNNFNAYAQTALRSGGRSGASVSFGFKWKY